RLHSTYKPLDRLTLTSSISYTYRTSANGKPGYGEVGRSGMYIYPYARFADELGNPLPVARDVRTSWADTVAHGGLLDWNYYPLIDHEQVSNRTYVDDILLNLGANYTILPGLDVDFKYLFERQHTKGRNHNGEQSYFARNMVNRFSQVEEGGAISRAVPVGAILDQINNLVESNNVRIQSNFNKAWRQHQITAIAGWELRRANRTGNRTRLFGYNDRTLVFSPVDLTRQYPIINGSGSQYITDNTSVFNNTTNFISYFSNASYT